MDLRQRRKQAGLTQAELARRVGCSTALMCLLENELRVVTDEMSELISLALDGKPVTRRGCVPFDSDALEVWFHELWIKKYG